MQNDSVRRAGQVNLTFQFTENNGKRLLLTRNALALQLKSRSLQDLWLFLANVDFSKADNAAFSNAVFGHVRYNRKWGPRLRWEVMNQWQYNKLLGIETRALAGTGPRYKWLAQPGGVAYLGCLYMFEYEKTTSDPPVIHRDHRMSSYLSTSLKLPDWLPGELVSTTYYQPLLKDFNDYRISHETSIELRLTAKLRVTMRYTYLYDARPPTGIRSKAQGVEQGLRLSF